METTNDGMGRPTRRWHRANGHLTRDTNLSSFPPIEPSLNSFLLIRKSKVLGQGIEPALLSSKPTHQKLRLFSSKIKAHFTLLTNHVFLLTFSPWSFIKPFT